ncbi:MAG: hypothetical protein ACR2QT_03195 [Woeseiaceae bacterium]
MMPSVASWLLARPQNAVFALALTMMMPGLATVCGAILFLLIVHQGMRKALQTAAFAGLILVVVALVSGSSPVNLLIGLLSFWLPIVALAAVARATRSLTLTLQLSVILVVLGTIAFFVLTNDPVAFWRDMIAANPVLQSLQLAEWKVALGVSEIEFAGVMSTMFAIGFWFGLVIVVMLGYWMYQTQPGKTGEFGRFCDLNFGRVIALLLAITSIAGFAFGVIWIKSIAVVVFAVFWLQGAAMVHWMHAVGYVPILVVFAAYVLTVLLFEYMFPALAVLGYTDAWFRYRHRVTRQQ